MVYAGQAKKLHTEWKTFKDGKGATMIKDAGLKLNSGLGPKLDSLDSKWGSKDGQKAADDIKKIVVAYENLINSAKPLKETQGAHKMPRDVTSTAPYEEPKRLAVAILKQIDSLAKQHALVQKAK